MKFVKQTISAGLIILSTSLTGCGGTDNSTIPEQVPPASETPVDSTPTPDTPTTGDGDSTAGFEELYFQGLDRYLGTFVPSSSDSIQGGGIVHTFSGDEQGPICYTGNEYTMSTRDGNSDELMIFLEGGGSCGPNLCDAIDRTLPGVPSRGIMNPNDADNPVADVNMAYVPYCDGSLFTGDTEVDVDGDGTIDRIHRGTINLSAALDVIANTYPAPNKILITGNSAGGFGTHVALPLVRRLYPLTPIELVNDSGVGISYQGSVASAIEYWNGTSNYPASCETCNGSSGHFTDYYKYQLQQDNNFRMAIISSKQDERVSREFPNGGADYEQVLIPSMAEVREAYPNTFRNFIINGDSHTMIQRNFDLEIGEISIKQWITDMWNESENWISFEEQD